MKSILDYCKDGSAGVASEPWSTVYAHIGKDANTIPYGTDTQSDMSFWLSGEFHTLTYSCDDSIDGTVNAQWGDGSREHDLRAVCD